MAIDYVGIGDRIRFLRLQKGWTQEELADRSNISRVHMGAIERGDKVASLESIISVANALEVSADELLTDNLIVTNCQNTGEDYQLILDCTPEEAAILTSTMKGLKETLRKYKIRK